MVSRRPPVFKRRKKSPAGIIVLVCVVAGIIVLGGGSAVFLISDSISSKIDQEDVQMNSFVSGNNLVAQILYTPQAESVTFLEMVMEGYTIPPGIGNQPVPEEEVYPKKIVYPNVAAGITGNLQILYRATFRDGHKATVWTGTVRFI